MTMRRAFPWLLMLSVAANVFMVALLVARPHHPPPHPPRGPLGMIEEMSERLPAADSALLRQALAHEIQRLGTLPQDVPPGPGRLQALMGANPFDPVRFRQEAEAIQAERNAMSESLTRIFLEALPAMSAEGRRKVADFRGGPGGPGGPPPR